MRAIAFIFMALVAAFAPTAGAHADDLGVERVQLAPLEVPVDHYVGFTAHADGQGATRGASGAVGGAVVAVVCAVALAVLGAVATADPDSLLALGSFMDFAFDAGDAGVSTAFTPAIVALRKKRATKIDEARAILDAAEKEDRSLTDEETTSYDALTGEVDAINEDLSRRERQHELDKQLEERTPVQTVEPGEQAPAPQARAGTDRGAEMRFATNALQLLRGIAIGNADQVRQAQSALAADGHYGDEARQAMESRAAGDYYSTLVDADGAILLPTQVAQDIDRIGEQVGVVRSLCTTFTHIVGELRVPGATGTITASAIAEGGSFTASMRALQAVLLNPKKWGALLPWTYEANAEAGPRILEDAEWGIAQAFERARDNAVVNGDGTAAFNGIDGVLSANRGSVGSYVLGAGAVSMDDITADDVHLMRRGIPPVLRSMASYLFHPDMEPKLRTLKDGNGQYIYAYNGDTGVATLGGRPVDYTEVLPAIGDDAPSLKFGIYGAWKMFKIAIGEGMSSEQLREAQIPDADTGATINLATQDLRALKVREFFDADCNFEEAFTVATTAAA